MQFVTVYLVRKMARRSRRERVFGYAGESLARIADRATNDSKP